MSKLNIYQLLVPSMRCGWDPTDNPECITHHSMSVTISLKNNRYEVRVVNEERGWNSSRRFDTWPEVVGVIYGLKTGYDAITTTAVSF